VFDASHTPRRPQTTLDAAQKGLGLSNEGIEDALYGSRAIRRFVGIDLARARPHRTPRRLKRRRLLE